MKRKAENPQNPGTGALRGGGGRFPAGLRRLFPRGFTLVEVVISLGIVAFAFIPVLGLLPFGLDVSRQAVDATVCAQIAQQLTSQAQQTDFSDIDSLAGQSAMLFDDQGNRLANGDPNAIYSAAYSVSAKTKLPNAVDVTTDMLATVTICVLNTKAGRTDRQTDPTASRDAKRYIILIPDNGR